MARLAPLALIVEDKAVIALAYAQMLGRSGFRTVLASTSAQVLTALGAELPSVAIVDLSLHDGDDGRPVAEALASRAVPIVIASAYAFELTPEFLDRVRPAAVLSKPFAPGRLAAEARRAVSAPSLMNEAGRSLNPGRSSSNQGRGRSRPT